MTKHPNIMTQTEYAKYKGVHKSRVTQWKKDGRLVFSDDGKFILVAESDARLKETVNLNGYANSVHAAAERAEINERIEQEKSYEELKNDVTNTQLDLETKDADELFKNARALREKAAALQAAAEHEKFIGSLVARDVVEKIIFERARQFRDGVIATSRRIAPDVIGKDSIVEIESIVQKELRGMLEHFAKLPVIE